MASAVRGTAHRGDGQDAVAARQRGQQIRREELQLGGPHRLVTGDAQDPAAQRDGTAMGGDRHAGDVLPDTLNTREHVPGWDDDHVALVAVP